MTTSRPPFQDMSNAVKKYRETGDLPSNPVLIRALYNAQKNIADNAVYFPEYELMRINAIQEAQRLERIMKNRNIPY